MEPPPKPWEGKIGQNAQNTGAIPKTHDPRRRFVNRMQSDAALPPPVPSRPGPQQNSYLGAGLRSPYSGYGYSNYGGGGLYGGGYGGYGGGYGGSSLYSPYGGGMGGGMYGGGFNRFGNDPGGGGGSRFVQAAEENSRQAFQSIEGIVQAFASVSMMLDSTFQALYSSFRAVLGVADHFTQLKLHLSHVLSTFAFFRTLQYLYRRLLVLLRLRRPDLAEDAWSDVASATGSATAGAGGKDQRSKSWPVFMFLAVVLGAPWLMWRLLCVSSSEDSGEGWATGEEDHVVVRATFDFESQNPDELSFSAGTLLNIAPKALQPKIKFGWLLASSDGKKTGFIPANYVKSLGKRRGKNYEMQQQQQPEPDVVQASVAASDPAAATIDSTDADSQSREEQMEGVFGRDREGQGPTPSSSATFDKIFDEQNSSANSSEKT